MSTKNYFDIECLITEVQCRPILWQDNHKDYKNKSITDLVWEDVGKQCNCSGAVAKLKWKNLKDSYRKNIQKLPPLKSDSKATTPCKVKWPYFEMMGFIKEYVAHTRGGSNLPDNSFISDDNIEEQPDEVSNDNVKDTYDFASTLNCTQEHSTSAPIQFLDPGFHSNSKCSQKSKYKYKKQRRDVDIEFLKLEEQRLELLKKDISNKSEENSDLQFFKSLLPFMELLSPIEKLEVRGEIQNVIINKLRFRQQV
ncbi:uncharacterized protein LOC117242680 [Bombus vosnesenskii]|uniref:Uncharacterized protein LOC117242680 n=2 Tax=Pyrobombus TaxID=144703 RepID=A0A6J3LNE0_9HYME|nr:uncharacterized protein LOC117156450 [Bombus vancouverensis nearcticus]XP_033316623.1 uncharacterized protein LOC117214547 [Bombus bifarius]XP_033365464.1 uncharacterized protein LOC117242680 [Bombus vosnesenskii]